MPDTAQPPFFFNGSTEEHIRKVALIVDELLRGKSNNGFAVTLVANAEETVVERTRISAETRVLLTPTSASAAQVLGSGMLWVETTVGRITIHHDANAAADRSFDAIVVG